jgi:hypothetical protein
MRSTRWFRMYAEMMDDPKVGRLSDADFRTWIELLCIQCAVGDDTGDTGLTPEELAWRMRRNVSETFHETFQRAFLVKLSKRGTVVIRAWAKRQFTADLSTERVRRHRAKLSKSNNVNNETVMKRFSNVSETNETPRARAYARSDSDSDSELNTKRAPEKKGRPEGEEGFAEFWGAYPRKVDKEDARRAWGKLAPGEELRAAIMAGLERWKRSRQWAEDGGRFIPHAATWLNKRRWEAEVEARPETPRPASAEPAAVEEPVPEVPAGAAEFGARNWPKVLEALGAELGPEPLEPWLGPETRCRGITWGAIWLEVPTEFFRRHVRRNLEEAIQRAAVAIWKLAGEPAVHYFVRDADP